METFAKLFERFLVFVYHCFDRIVIQGYLPLLTRSEHIVYFFREVHGIYPITPQVLAKRTPQYRAWVESYARNHKIPIQSPERAKARKTSSVLTSNVWSVAATTACTSSFRAWKWAVRFARSRRSIRPTIRTIASYAGAGHATCTTTSTSAIR